MLAKVIIENGQKKIQPLTADTGVGAPVGSLISMYKKSSPSGYLYCDGSTFDQTKYPSLYAYLGSNVLPDYRECVEVGAEQNTTDSIATHDVYTLGQFKDDQLQDHNHAQYLKSENGRNLVTSEYTGTNGWKVTDDGATVQNKGVIAYAMGDSGRKGTTTHGKQKAVFIYIKATSGLTENQQENVLNTINENNSYSTEEHPTGKKWIDGKPIYRIVLTTTSQINADDVSFGGLQTIISNLNIDTAIYAGGIDNTNRKSFRALLFSSTSGFLPLGSGLAPNSKIIFEYTKTTD